LSDKHHPALIRVVIRKGNERDSLEKERSTRFYALTSELGVLIVKHGSCFFDPGGGEDGEGHRLGGGKSAAVTGVLAGPREPDRFALHEGKRDAQKKKVIHRRVTPKKKEGKRLPKGAAEIV